MAPIRPYKIDISDARIEKLHKKLELADFPTEPEAGTEYGASVYVLPFLRSRLSSRHLSFLIVRILINNTAQKSSNLQNTGAMDSIGRNKKLVLTSFRTSRPWFRLMDLEKWTCISFIKRVLLRVPFHYCLFMAVSFGCVETMDID